MFMTVMGMTFVSCDHDAEDIPCKDCEKKVAVIIDVVSADGMPMSRSLGYRTWGAGTYDTDKKPLVGAEADPGYKITKFDRWTEVNGLEVLSTTKRERVENQANGALGNHRYTITVEAEQKFTNTVTSGTGGSASGSFSGITGSTHSIIASAYSDYKFKKWTCTGGASVINSYSSSTTATIGSSNGTILANFERKAPATWKISITETMDGRPTWNYGGPYSYDNLGIITPSTSDWTKEVKEGTFFRVSAQTSSSSFKLKTFTVNGQDCSRTGEWQGNITQNTSVVIEWVKGGTYPL